jgi:putative PIN family toxin of toxin-antitoxin system
VRAVLDTNVVVSALLWDGVPEQILQRASQGELELVTSPALLAELAGILNRPKFAHKLNEKNASPAEIVALYMQIAKAIEATPIEESSLRDPDDAVALACALAARADLIVSGDDDLLTLGSYQGIPILSAAQCLQRLDAESENPSP